MKKIVLLLVIIFFTFSILGARSFSVSLNFFYDHGLGDFFKQKESRSFIDGKTHLLHIQNKTGFGLGLGIAVPILHSLSLVSEGNLIFGQRETQDQLVSDPNNTTFKHAYFRLFSGSLNAKYIILCLANGWQMDAMSGFSLNFPSADQEVEFAQSSYAGWQIAAGATFQSHRHFDFHLRLFYKLWFTSEKISFAGLTSGISYIL